MQVVAMSGEPNIPLAVRAIQAGALEFLMKPLTEEVLRATVQRALDQSQAVLRQEAESLELRNRHDSFSARQRDVTVRLRSGFLTKQGGGGPGILELTGQRHPGRANGHVAPRSLVAGRGRGLRV